MIDRYHNTVHGFTRMAREEGIRGFYKGLGPALPLTTLHGAIQFGVYEELRKLLVHFNDEPGPHEFFVIGSLSKVAATVGTYPIQLVKTRLQQRPVRYINSLDVLRRTWHGEGMRGFFRGMLPALLRTTPASALTISVYEFCQKTLTAHNAAR